MSKFLTLLGREVKSFFYSPIAYVVMFFFLLITGFNFYIGVSLLNRGPTEVTVIEAFFNTVLFWIAYLLIFPLGLRLDVSWLGFLERTTLRFDFARTINSSAPLQFWFGIQHPF